MSEQYQSGIFSEIYNEPFFSHATLDENIGNGIGNNVIDVINKFHEHLPEGAKSRFVETTRYCNSLHEFRQRHVKFRIKKRSFTDYVYVIDQSTEIPNQKLDGKRTTEELGMMYIDVGRSFISLYEDPKDGRYLKYDSRHVVSGIHIDEECEKKMNDDIDKLLVDIIGTSKTTPIFIPIGYVNEKSGHLIGLLLTDIYIIIANSGDGLEFHRNNMGDDTYQCILHFNRPCDLTLHYLLKKLIAINTIRKNTNVVSVYSVILWIYFHSLISNMNINEKISQFVNSYINTQSVRKALKKESCVSRSFETKSCINSDSIPVVYDDTLNSLVIGNKSSYIKDSVWIHPVYYSTNVYNIKFINHEPIRRMNDFFTKDFLKSTFTEDKQANDVYATITTAIKDKLASFLGEDHINKLNIVLKQNEIEAIMNNIAGINKDEKIPISSSYVDSSISKIVAEDELYTDLLACFDKTNDKTYHIYNEEKISHVHRTREFIELLNLLNNDENIIKKIKTDLQFNEWGILSDGERAPTKKLYINSNIPTISDMIKIRESNIIGDVCTFSVATKKLLLDYIKSILTSSYYDQLLHGLAPFNKEMFNIDEEKQKAFDTSTFKIAPFCNKFNYTDVPQHNEDIIFFIDLLLNHPNIKMNSFTFESHEYPSIIVFQRASTHSINIDAFERKKMDPIIAQLLKTPLKNILSNFPENFYVREQYAGSCTYNGVLLITSLIWREDFSRISAHDPEPSLSQVYNKSYNDLRSHIFDTQIKRIEAILDKKHDDTQITTKDRLLIGALINLCNQHPTKMSKLREKLEVLQDLQNNFVHQVEFIQGAYVQQIHNESFEPLYLQFDFNSPPDIINNIKGLLEKKLYNDYYFEKYCFVPIISKVIKKEIDVAVFVDLLEDNIMHIDHSECTALCIMILYFLLKNLDESGVVDKEKISNINAEYDRRVDDDKRFIRCMYFRTILKYEIVRDICDVITKYQFIFDGNSNTSDHPHSIFDCIDCINRKKSLEISTPPDDYATFSSLSAIKKINKYIYTNNNFLSTFEIYGSQRKIEKYIVQEDTNSAPYYDQTEIDEGSITITKLTGWVHSVKIKNEHKILCIKTVPYDKNDNYDNYAFVNNQLIKISQSNMLFIDIDSMLDIPTNSPERTFDMSFKYPVTIDDSKTFATSKNYNDICKSNRSTCSIEHNYIATSFYEHQYGNVIDMMYIRSLITTGKIVQCNKYLSAFTTKDYLQIRLLPFIEPLKVEESEVNYKIDPTNEEPDQRYSWEVKRYEDIYASKSAYKTYNTHDVVQYYDELAKKIFDDIKGIDLRENARSIIKKLKVMTGIEMIDDKAAKIGISENKLRILLNAETTAQINLTSQSKTFNLDDGGKNNLVYESNTDIYIDTDIERYKLILHNDELTAILTSTPNKQFLLNVNEYARNINIFIIGLNKLHTKAIIIFPQKNGNYYANKLQGHPWVNNPIPPADFIEMQKDVPPIIFVNFDIDTFNGCVPVYDHYINSIGHYSMLTFTLFCETLLLEGKYMLFNLLLPQLVGCYFMYDKIGTVDLTNHKKFIDYVLTNDYVLSPYAWYFICKLQLMVKGETSMIANMSLQKRSKYYDNCFSTINYIPTIKKGPKFDVSHYNKWIDTYITVSNKPAKEIQTVARAILDKIDDSDANFCLNIKDILKHPTILDFYYANYEKLVKSLQCNIISKVVSNLDNVHNDIEIMGNIKYFVKKSFDHESDTDLALCVKLFELISGKILDELQYAFVERLINEDVSEIYNVHELLMGRGKTHVIIPCVLFYFAMTGKFSNLISCMPSHLLYQSMKNLNKLWSFITDGFIVMSNIDRSMEYRGSLDDVIKNSTRKIILLDDKSIKAYLLDCAEYASARIGDCNHGPNPKKNGTDIIKFPEKIYMRDNSLIIFDEFDTLVDPLKSDLNYPIKKSKNIERQNDVIDIVISMTEILFNKYKTYLFFSDRADINNNRLVVRDILNDTSMQEKFRDLVGKIKARFANVTKIEQYSDITQGDQDTLAKLTGGSYESLCAYYIREIYYTYITCIEMMLDKDYGWDDTNIENPFVVVPYVAQKTPAKGSKFSDPLINIILTTITYFSKPLRKIDVDKIGDYIRSSMAYCSEDYFKNEKDIDFDGIKYALLGDDERLYKHLNDLRVRDGYATYMNYVKMFLHDVVLYNYIKIDTELLNCSFIDIIDPNFIKSKFALSGTVNVSLPSFNYYGDRYKLKGILTDEPTRATINAVINRRNLLKVDGRMDGSVDNGDDKSIISLQNMEQFKELKFKSTDVPVLQNIDEKSKPLIFNIIYLMVHDPRNYNILIDVGSFLRNYTNREIALFLSCGDNDRVILYFDEADRLMAVRNMLPIYYDTRQLKHDRNTKIYIDQKHTIGTDIDLHSESSGLITVSDNVTKSALVQGIFRLREVDLYQKITYLTKGNEYNTIDKLVKKITNNETKYLDSAKDKFTKQTILCLFRGLHDYDERGYKFNLFDPTDKISETIFVDRSYNHDYTKEAFVSYIKENKPSISDSQLTIDGELDELLNAYNMMDRQKVTVHITTQKQTAMEKEIEKVIEKNSHRKGGLMGDLGIDAISYGSLLNLANNNITHDDKRNIFMNTPIMKFICEELHVNFSPNAIWNIHRIFKEGNTDALYYYIHDKIKGSIYITTSIDMYIFHCYKRSLFDEAVELNVFNTESNLLGLCVNAVMLLLLKIPSHSNIKFMEQYKNTTSDIIFDKSMSKLLAIAKEHYNKVYIYNVASISPVFAKLLEGAT